MLLFISQDEELARQLVELGYRGSGEVRKIYLVKSHFTLIIKVCLHQKRKKKGLYTVLKLLRNISLGLKQVCKGE